MEHKVAKVHSVGFNAVAETQLSSI